MTDNGAPCDYFVMIADGGSEYGALITLRYGRVCAITMSNAPLPQEPPTDLIAHITLINRLLAQGLEFSALTVLAADSPRLGPLIEQINARLAAASEELRA
jgi:hypothetical protein